MPPTDNVPPNGHNPNPFAYIPGGGTGMAGGISSNPPYTGVGVQTPPPSPYEGALDDCKSAVGALETEVEALVNEIDDILSPPQLSLAVAGSNEEIAVPLQSMLVGEIRTLTYRLHDLLGVVRGARGRIEL